MSKTKAYVVTYDGWLGYWAAETASQARYTAWKQVYRNLGSDCLTDIRVRRFPDLDDRALSRGDIPVTFGERAFFKKKYKLKGGRERYGV